MAFSIEIISGLLLGIFAYISLYLGKGIQKFAIEGYKDRGKYKGKGKNTGIWIFGTILTSLFMFIQWIALLYAPINIIAPIEGLGLVVLVIFSYFILKESISKSQIFGIILIIIGTIEITLFNENPSSVPFNALNFELLTIISIILIAIEIAVFSFSKYYKLKAIGYISGLIAGTFMAFQTVSKRITAIPNSLLSTAFIFITLIMAVLTLIMTQYAFTKANANIVVPCTTSSSIILAILIGVISLSEQMIVNQIIGVVFLIGGIILLTGFNIELEKSK